MTNPQESVSQLEAILDHRFENRDLITQAITHKSTQVDFPQRTYERLEFLGDRVLNLVIAELLLNKFPQEAEGPLAKRHAKLVSQPAILEVAGTLKISQFVMASLAQRLSDKGKSKSIIADVCEALIAALYLDAGLEKTKAFVIKHWEPLMDQALDPPIDPKSLLQETLQEKGLPLPEYKVVDQQGPSHSPIFTVLLTIQPYGTTKTQGSSRKDAEKAAAAAMLELIKNHA